jgi:hypothetical protein
VAVEVVVFGHQSVEKNIQVVDHIRVGVLLNGQRRRGMLHENGK